MGPLFFALPAGYGSCAVSGTTLERVAAGDPAAVEECLQKYGGLVWSLARRLIQARTDRGRG